MYYAIMNLTSIYLPKIIGNAISAPIPSKNLRDRVRRYIRFILDEQLQPLCKTEKLVANHLQTNYIKHKISQYQLYQPKKPASTSEKIVWQYWAQGIEHSPEIIKICLQSVNSYFSQYGYRVIYLSDNNIREYLVLIHYTSRKHQQKTATALPSFPILYALVYYIITAAFGATQRFSSPAILIIL